MINETHYVKGGNMDNNDFTNDETSIGSRPRYTQKWHEYNLAQTSEKAMFLDILRDLCATIPIKEAKRRGRPSLNIQEIVFCMAVLVYNEKSSRRIISELHLAKDRNLISKVPHFNSILNYFNKKELRNYLQTLIQYSSHPIKDLEQDFAVDASGFSTSQFSNWNSYKWGKHDGKERVWRKAHVMSGVKTNIITAIEVTPKNVADTKEFCNLVEKTSRVFQMREVSADKAYLGRDNLSHVTKFGAIPFIPFKSNSQGKSRGSIIWRRMFLYFSEHYEEYMQHYHKRSNAETVFSMIKRKFTMNLRNKNYDAQENEILCKALCHNICVLIHEVFESGIETDFTQFCTFNQEPAKKIPGYY